MIRASCPMVIATLGLAALTACAAGGEGGDEKETGYGGSAGTGFGGSGFGGSSGTGFGGSSGSSGTGFGGSSGSSGSSGSGFGGSSGSGFGGSTGSGFGGSTGSGFGGTSGTGTVGAAGTGTVGAAGTGSGAVPGVADLIDDLELGTGSIPSTNGRVGAWYTYNDETAAGTQTPTAGMPFVVDPGGYNGTKCARTHGSGFTVWGAGMGVDLNNNGTTKGTHSAAAYQGIVFQAKATTPFRVKVLIPATTPTAEGGTCAGAGCGNSHGAIVNATTTWASYNVPFTELKQEVWADVNNAEFSKAAIIGIQFQVVKDAVFDVAIDNLGFY